ncbi:MAG: 30S ribosomal protein S5 [Parcubacteria group bacterium]|nr:30S ribosomal protein S5 [Parcubacteria group bacterium]
MTPTPNTSAKTPQKRGDSRGPRRGGPRRDSREDSEFDQKILDIARVTRVTEGGKRMSFRATVAVGDHRNRVAIGIGKGLDVTIAVNKAVTQAKKDMMRVPLTKTGSIAHSSSAKYGASKVMVKPAPTGTGIIAGGVMRIILELAGVRNVTAKIIGSPNKINNARATLLALANIRPFVSRRRAS